MTSQPGQKITIIHILPNISGSKGNQTIKFGQLIEYNMRNIFLEKSYTKYNGKVLKFVFIVCPSRGLPRYIKTKLLTTCFYLTYSLRTPIDYHWFKNVLLELFSFQLCLFFFHKMMKFYKGICFVWISRTFAEIAS